MTKYTVYGIGNALVDNDYHVSDETLDELHIKKSSHELIDLAKCQKIFKTFANLDCQRNCGGSVSNSIYLMAQFGIKCFFSTRVGNDRNGRFFQDTLWKENIDSNLTNQILPDESTGTSFVLVTPDAERSLQTFLGATELMSEHEIDMDALRQSEYFFVEGFLAAQPAALQAVKHALYVARENNTKIVVSLSDTYIIKFFKTELMSILEGGVDILFCNEKEALRVTNTDNIEIALAKCQKFAKQVVITRSERGSLLFDGSNVYDVPAVDTQVIDTVGAGDTFAGTFLYAIIRGFDFVTAAKMASYMAAHIISKYTARFSEEEFAKLKDELCERYDVELA